MEKISLEGKVVRFISVDRKYTRTPYPAIPVESVSKNTFLTGQHIDPENPETFDNLTKDEMTGEVEIKPAARKKRFPYVINPWNPIYIQHGKKYNCRTEKGIPVNPKDFAEAHCLLYLTDLVAPSKDKLRPGYHKFYLEDKEHEAAVSVRKDDLIYEAETLIRTKANVSDYSKIINVLNLVDDKFYQNAKGLSELRMKSLLIEEAKKNPNTIIKLFDEGSNIYFFIVSLIEAKVLDKRPDGFYNASRFIAMNVNELVSFMNNKANADLVLKWKKIVVPETVDSN